MYEVSFVWDEKQEKKKQINYTIAFIIKKMFDNISTMKWAKVLGVLFVCLITMVVYTKLVMANDQEEIWEAEDIREMMLVGKPISLDGVTIVGDLNIEDAIVSSTITLTSCTFKGDVVFEGVIFEERVIFNDSWFKKNVSFNEVEFASAEFSNSKFDNRAEFVDSKFNGTVVFMGAEFGNVADFDETTFRSVIFKDAEFKNNVSFRYTTFSERVSLKGVTFAGNANFSGAKFESRVYIPFQIEGSILIYWYQIKHQVTGEDEGLFWEDVFTKSGHPVDARSARKYVNRSELSDLIFALVFSFINLMLIFPAMFYIRFRKERKVSRKRFFGKIMLFSLDIITPGIRLYRYDWEKEGNIPVSKVVVLTAIESAIGWILLALGSAIAVAWLLA